MLSDDLLAPGWEWRRSGKVKRGHKHYMRVDGTDIKYVGVGRGDYTVLCSGGHPYLKLAALTHYDDELQERIREHKQTIRDNFNSL